MIYLSMPWTSWWASKRVVGMSDTPCRSGDWKKKIPVPHNQVALQSWWRHQMEIFSALLALCVGVHRSPVNSPHKGQWRGALMFSLICALNKRLSKQSWDWWFETPSRSLWRHCNVTGLSAAGLRAVKPYANCVLMRFVWYQSSQYDGCLCVGAK